MQYQDLLHIELFSNIEPEFWEAEVEAELVKLQPGEFLFRVGDKATQIYVILEGRLDMYRETRQERISTGSLTTGSWGGEVSTLVGSDRFSHGVAVTPCQILVYHEEGLWSLMARSAAVRRKLLTTLAERMSVVQTLSLHRSKLESIGQMSAGLAHELNNPAAAARRAAQTIVKTLDQLGDSVLDILNSVVFEQGPVNQHPIQEFYEQIQFTGVTWDSLTQSDLEEELTLWLEEQQVQDPQEMASTFISVGLTKEILLDLLERNPLHPEAVRRFFRWLCKDIEIRQLAQELTQGTTRISELISALKSYSYMDRVREKQKIDVHEGINDTLIILKHKLKQKQIQIKKDYAPDLPQIHAYGGELNQVWTNLIDNACYVLPDRGTIILRTQLDPLNSGRVLIEVIDDGPGVPRELQQFVFDPFFTTKDVGEGTGLGLDICYKIITFRHQGSIELRSRTGYTEFRISLPIEPRQEEDRTLPEIHSPESS